MALNDSALTYYNREITNTTSKPITEQEPLESSYVAVATGQTDSAVSGGAPASVYGLFVTAQGVSDSILIKDGSTTIFTIVPGATGAIDLGNNGAGIKFTTSVVVTTGANESCVVYYRVT